MSRSDELFQRAQQTIPGGVNSPVRAFRAVGGTPRFIESAQGAHIVDADGRRYIDYVGSWGPMILGHGAPAVVEAIRDQAGRGVSFGAPTELEIDLAEAVRERVPSMEQLRMVNSGTEATMTAIRLARGHTGRDKLLKFEGCYHGHGDALLVKAGSGALTLGVPSSPGVPASFVEHTLSARFNDLDSVDALLAEHAADLACIIVEPVAGNMNCVPPDPGFLEGLRERCDAHGIVLIFDEVMTGFRVHPGGAQARYGVKPDLTTLGKIVGGGLPVGAFGGTAAIMANLAPVGPAEGLVPGRLVRRGDAVGEVARVVAHPAEQSGRGAFVELDPGLAQVLVDDARGGAHVLADVEVGHGGGLAARLVRPVRPLRLAGLRCVVVVEDRQHG